MKFKEKILALSLRKKGLSYGEILKEIKVSKSTLSIWLREVELSDIQKNKLKNKMDIVRYNVAKRKVKNRIDQTKKIIMEAKKESLKLKENKLFLFGLALYWAEGAKNPVESVKFANSDAQMIKIIMFWFREICKVPENKFRIHVHMHNLHSRNNIINYWSKITNIPKKQFYKPYIKETSLGQRKNILYNGTCSVIIHNKNLFRRIKGWKLGITETFISL